VDREPKRIIIRILEYAALFALAMFLVHLGVAYLKDVWWILLILAAIVTGIVIVYRVWRGRTKKW